MWFSPNRWASIFYFILSALPIGIFIILADAMGVDRLWQAQPLRWVSIGMPILGIASLALAITCFPNRVRSRTTHLILLAASLLFVAFALYMLSWIYALFSLTPLCLLWKSYREAASLPASA
jgi:hypothetical protein